MADVVPRPNGDPLPGVTFRACRRAADYPAFAELATLTSADDFEIVYSADWFARFFDKDLAGFDPQSSVLVAEAGDRIIGHGYGYYEGDEPATGRVLWTTCRVHPDWRGRGIERTLLSAAQASARRHAASRPPTTLAPVFRTLAGEGATKTIEALADNGYRPVRWLYLMVRPTLHDPPDDTLPPGIEVRPVRPEDGPAVLRAHDEAMRDHWDWHPDSEESIATRLADPRDGQLDVWQVAWEGDEVVGACSGGSTRRRTGSKVACAVPPRTSSPDGRGAGRGSPERSSAGTSASSPDAA